MGEHMITENKLDETKVAREYKYYIRTQHMFS